MPFSFCIDQLRDGTIKPKVSDGSFRVDDSHRWMNFRILQGSILECQVYEWDGVVAEMIDTIREVVMCKITKYFEKRETMAMTLKFLDDYASKLDQMIQQAKPPDNAITKLNEFRTRLLKLHENAMGVEVLRLTVSVGRMERNGEIKCKKSDRAQDGFALGICTLLLPLTSIFYAAHKRNPLRQMYVDWRLLLPTKYYDVHLNSCYTVKFDDDDIGQMASYLSSAVTCVSKAVVLVT